jgi:hypothetical protein
LDTVGWRVPAEEMINNALGEETCRYTVCREGG